MTGASDRTTVHLEPWPATESGQGEKVRPSVVEKVEWRARFNDQLGFFCQRLIAGYDKPRKTSGLKRGPRPGRKRRFQGGWKETNQLCHFRRGCTRGAFGRAPPTSTNAGSCSAACVTTSAPVDLVQRCMQQETRLMWHRKEATKLAASSAWRQKSDRRTLNSTFKS